MRKDNKIPEAKDRPGNCLAASEKSGDRGRVVGRSRGVQNHRSSVGERFTAVNHRIKAHAFRLHLANPCVCGTPKNGHEQIAVDYCQSLIAEGLFQLLPSPTEFRDVLQDAGDLGLDGLDDCRLNAKVGPQQPEDAELLGGD